MARGTSGEKTSNWSEKAMKAKKVTKPIIIYGKGNLGKLAVEIFECLNVTVVGSIDQTDEKVFVNPELYTVAVAIATSPFNEIREFLIKKGYTDIVPFWDIVEAYPKLKIHNGWFAEPIVPKVEKQIQSVQDSFSDLISVNHYIQFRTWREYRIEEIIISPTLDGYHVYPSTLEHIRLRRRNWNSIQHCATVRNEKISIHTEGEELRTIKQYIGHYCYYRPILDVACYHSRDGLWRIQKLLIDNLKNYTFKFRCHAYCGQAAVFYCIPKEVEK